MSDINQRIENLLSEHKVVLFMKGTKDAPMCGFSARVIQILDHLGAEYHDINVLADNEIREGIKAYTNWPTIPQLYIEKEFVGGCDIITEMFTDGELKSLLVEKSLISA